jgi:hypothetical protein
MQLKKTAAIRATRFGKTTLGSRPKVFDEALPEKGFPGTQKHKVEAARTKKKEEVMDSLLESSGRSLPKSSSRL